MQTSLMMDSVIVQTPVSCDIPRQQIAHEPQNLKQQLKKREKKSQIFLNLSKLSCYKIVLLIF